jgi:hypothetical protein
MEHRATRGTVHTVPGIIDLEGSGIASGPVGGPSRKQHLPEVYGDLAEWSTGTLLACLWIAACFYVCALYNSVL